MLGAFRGFRVVGVAPDEMGVGPAVAIPAVLAQTRLRVDMIDAFEINEAFASQAATRFARRAGDGDSGRVALHQDAASGVHWLTYDAAAAEPLSNGTLPSIPQ